MEVKRSFRGEIFLYFIIVFILFTVAVLTFQYQREKIYKTTQLETTLDDIAEITHLFIKNNNLEQNNNFDRIKEISELIPQPNTRLTVIDLKGTVLFDSFVENYKAMENHINRPEVQTALAEGSGSNIRLSSTTNQEYYYYAKKRGNFFIRAAILYNIEVQDFLKTSRTFIFFIIALFAIIGTLLFLVTLRLSVAITKLKDFSVKAGKNELVEFEDTFPENELGVIGSQIIQIYNKLKITKDDLANEKDKLLSHLDALDEGIAFFSSDKEKTLSNSRFIQLVNLFARKNINTSEKILKIKEFTKVVNFLDKNLSENKEIDIKALPQIEYTVSKDEKYFKIQSIIFFDKSFEIVITDVTRLMKRRLLKQQLTSNIAHELKTPLASIKGYLETILDNWPIPAEKQKYFLEKAYFQSDRLTDLINDVSLINNIENAGDLFEQKKIDIHKVVNDVYENFANRMENHNVKFSNEVEKGTSVEGNESLLFSVFQNLVENSINYAGRNIKIVVQCYHQDNKYYYFSYSDTGVGIPNEHLARIFERFYRVDPGRSREKGGTGLGLAIVKNAIQMHKGEISVKNNPKGGVQFLFSISKN